MAKQSIINFQPQRRAFPAPAASNKQQTLASTDRTSLIPDSLAQLAANPTNSTASAQVLTRKEQRLRQRALDDLKLPTFQKTLQANGLPQLHRGPTTMLQLNIGLYCNQACDHCHVESSPLRTEMMSREVADQCLRILEHNLDTVTTLDITGGAPELNANFRYLVQRAREIGVSEIIDRCNLTVLLEPGQEDLVQFLAEHKLRVVASLPCYSAGNVDQQRGRGVFERSIQGLQLLNSAGYGQPDSGLLLDLVYNPNGTFLAPAQSKLEPAYKEELQSAYGIMFNNLLALNNMPIKRFADFLVRQGKLEDYMQLLVTAFNPSAVQGVMCHNTLSVGWDGKLYDCDFNQQLAMQIRQKVLQQNLADENVGAVGKSSGLTVFDIETVHDLTGAPIRVGSHCYGCTAGSGSSCGGGLA